MNTQKPIIGFSCGDINGVGTEVIIKCLMDTRITELCTPVVFASNKLINFYKKTIADCSLNYQSVKEWEKINPKTVNVLQCWDEETDITPGQLNDVGGKYGILSLNAATQALKEQKIHALVTAPIHKKNVQSDRFPYTGHTPYLQKYFQVPDVLMFMISENMRVGLLTEHIPVSQKLPEDFRLAEPTLVAYRNQHSFNSASRPCWGAWKIPNKSRVQYELLIMYKKNMRKISLNL